MEELTDKEQIKRLKDRLSAVRRNHNKMSKDFVKLRYEYNRLLTQNELLTGALKSHQNYGIDDKK